MTKRLSQVVCIVMVLFAVLIFVNSSEANAAEKELYKQLDNTYDNPSAEVTFTKSFAGSSAGDVYSMTIANWSHDTVCLSIKVTEVKTGKDYDITGSLHSDDKENYSLPHNWKLPFKDRAQYLYITIGKDIPASADATYSFTVSMITQDECSHKKGKGTTLKKTATEHTVSYECKWCGKKDIITETGEHTFKPTGESYSDTTHRIECTACGYGISEDCKFTKAKYTKYNGNCHKKELVCADCGNIKSTEYEEHKVKNGKCKHCSAKIVTPGTTKITSVKQQKAYTKKTKTEGHWAGSVWISATTATSYFYPLTVEYTKAKNAEKYIISLSKPVKTLDSTTGLSVSTKTTYDFKNPTMGVKTNKITVYVTPVSSTGTYGKSVKKTITLKQP